MDKGFIISLGNKSMAKVQKYIDYMNKEREENDNKKSNGVKQKQ